MVTLKPFRGLRPPRELAQKIACPPYDVVSTKEARAYAEDNEYCFFHISRPETDSPEGDEHEAAARNLKRFRDAGWFLQDKNPSFYLYRQQMGAHVQTGLVAAASVEEYDAGLIRKHELTRPDKEDDRARHIHALQANDEPVFLTYRANPEIDALIAELTQAPPEYDFVSEDNVAHTFWAVPEKCNEIEAAFQRVPTLYIADGHHRIAAASRVRQLMRDKGNSGKFLAVVFPHDQVQILAYNRVVKDLNGLSRDTLLDKLSHRFRVSPTTTKKPEAARSFAMYLRSTWYELSADNSLSNDLDVSILQNQVLSPILGIRDPRTDSRVQFVGGIRGTDELEKLVDSEEYAVAFSLFPTHVEQLFAVADRGGIMPPKSTWFEPKLRSGLILHSFL